MRRVAAALVCVALCPGCGEDLSPASLIDKTRAIAARVEVVGQPDRANPGPGDFVTVETRVVGPGPRQPLQWLFVPCIPADVGFGPPICDGPDSIIQPCLGCESSAGSFDDPVIQFQVPMESELGDADSVVAFGAVCANGPVLDFDDFVSFFNEGRQNLSPCRDPNDEGSLLFVDVSLQQAGSDNLHPAIEEIRLGGSTWTDVAPSDAPAEECGDVPVRQLPPGTGPIAVGLVAQTGSRQEFVDPLTEETMCEDLQISWLGTGGEFDRSFGFIEEETCSSAQASNGSDSVGWMPPQTAPPGGMLVRFYFVLRDGRGGTDWAERALCIVP